MKLLHIADLHIGKRVNAFSMIEDQRYILNQILDIVECEQADGLLIAGDVYDKRMPNADAVILLDTFLTDLSTRGCTVFMVSGNHDSPERLGFGSHLLKGAGLHIAGAYNGALTHHTLTDAHGTVNLYLMPFLKPAMVNPFLETPVSTYDQAVRAVIDAAGIRSDERNVLVAHQFVTAGTWTPERSDSENLSIGGVDNVDVSAFDPFDYVALGHIHRPQQIGRDTIRYAGSPLKYSFSEARHQKSVTRIVLGEKGAVECTQIPLTPYRDMREIKGPLHALIEAATQDTDDYIHATLTDEGPLYDALGHLRTVYPNLMALDFDNYRSRLGTDSQTAASGDVSEKDPNELFAAFYKLQNNVPLPDASEKWMMKIFERAAGGDHETD